MIDMFDAIIFLKIMFEIKVRQKLCLLSLAIGKKNDKGIDIRRTEKL